MLQPPGDLDPFLDVFDWEDLTGVALRNYSKWSFWEVYDSRSGYLLGRNTFALDAMCMSCHHITVTSPHI